jgi:hypothetical protein
MRARASDVLLACIGVALLLGAVARSAAGPTGPSFAAPKRYATDSSPGPLAIADLNGDGKPELVVASGDADALPVFVNRGDGSFEARRDYGTGRTPDSLAIADLNGDGKRDLVTAYTSGTVSVLLNSGDGSFAPRNDYSAGRGAGSLAIADLNGDGKPDLATANYDAGSVSVLLNGGDGSFEAKRDYATGREPFQLAIGDVSGDGKPDLLTNTSAGNVSLFVNHGDGSFEPRRDYATGVGSADLLTLADLNGDGKRDLAFWGEESAPSVSVWLNKGDGSFRHEDLRTCWPCFGTSSLGWVGAIAIADLNGDGKLDLVSRNLDDVSGSTEPAGSVSVFLNKGDGTFRRQHEYPTGFNSPALVRGPGSLAIADLNGDGKPEIVVAENRVTVLVNRGDGSFRPKLEYPGGSSDLTGFATADLNADGRADLVTMVGGPGRGPTGSVRVLLNTPGLCNVQGLVGKTPAAANRKLARVNCRLGKIGRAYSKSVKKGRVISQKPKFGAVRPGGAKVNLVISRGRKH